MFAVPGWSVSIADLKRQTASAEEQRKKQSKKRKRGGDGVQVTQDNVGQMWDMYVEKKDASSQGIDNGKRGIKKQKKKEEKNRKHDKEERPINGTATNQDVLTQEVPIPTVRLTPLQQQMAAKLTGARFRHLNQTLYTSPSAAAMKLFADSPDAYHAYHEGFRAQVRAWPSNPVDRFIEEYKRRYHIHKRPRFDKNKNKNGTCGDGDVQPLPQSKTGVCRVVDLGCGDAQFAAALRSLKRVEVSSFDLAKGQTANADLITVADITDLQAVGVANGTVDLAICCLSLMGTNWIGVVDECARVTREGGEMWVAEIKSRFASKKGRTAIGNVRDDRPFDEEELEEPKAAKQDTTDVSDFVAAFERRGFLLKEPPDLSNKMFITMKFVRRRAMNIEDRSGQNGRPKQRKTKFIDNEPRQRVDESKILKPCLYKPR